MFGSEKVFRFSPGQQQASPDKERQSPEDVRIEEENEHSFEEFLSIKTPRKVPLIRSCTLLKPKRKEFFSLRRSDTPPKARRRLSYHCASVEKDYEEKAGDAFATLDVSDKIKSHSDHIWPDRQQKRRRNRLKRLTKDFGSNSNIPPYSSSRSIPIQRNCLNNSLSSCNFDHSTSSEMLSLSVPKEQDVLEELRRWAGHFDRENAEQPMCRSVPEFWQVDLD